MTTLSSALSITSDRLLLPQGPITKGGRRNVRLHLKSELSSHTCLTHQYIEE